MNDTDVKLQLSVPKRELMAMRELQSVDETRFVLNGVNFQVSKKRLLLVATDGRKIGILLSEVGETELELSRMTGPLEFTCDYPLVKYLKADSIGRVLLKYDGKHIEFSDGDTAITVAAIEGNFPKWTHVVPRGKFVKADYHFNVKYLQQFHMCAKILNPTSDGHVHLRGHDFDSGGYKDSQPPYSVFFDNPNFYGFLMPVAMSHESELPGWLHTEIEGPSLEPIGETPAKKTHATASK